MGVAARAWGGRFRAAAGAWPSPLTLVLQGQPVPSELEAWPQSPQLQRDSSPALGQRHTAEGQPLWAAAGPSASWSRPPP